MEEISEHDASANTASEHEEGAMEKADCQGQAEALRAGLATISKDIIRELKQELRQELTALGVELKQEVKEEFSSFRQDIDRKLNKISSDLQAQKTDISEAQTRISKLEEWKADAKDVLAEMCEQTDRLREKVTDLEGRSRRNNIRVFGIPEGTEGVSVAKYLEQLLKTELQLPEGTALQIQRAHRALAPKPGPGAAPRSIVANFLQFEIKEMVLKTAWQKKIQVGGKQVFFDHDYTTEIVQKRKTYVGIKKVLKEKGIRFQTPLTKIRIHWNNGVRTYGRSRTRHGGKRLHCGYARRGQRTRDGREDARRDGVATSDGAKTEPGYSTASERKTARFSVEILKRFFWGEKATRRA